MRLRAVQNVVWCRAVRAGRGIGTPLAERERYNETVLHRTVQIVQNGKNVNGDW